MKHKIHYLDLLKENLGSKYNLEIDVKKSEPACTLCLPMAPLKDHLYYNGVMVHSRIDCEPDTFYMINENRLSPPSDKGERK